MGIGKKPRMNTDKHRWKNTNRGDGSGTVLTKKDSGTGPRQVNQPWMETDQKGKVND
jgi:hypothetical protein